MVIAAEVRELLLLKIVEEVIDEVDGFPHHPRQVYHIDLVCAVPVELRVMRDEGHQLLEWDLPNA